jgi:hypothetical protein
VNSINLLGAIKQRGRAPLRFYKRAHAPECGFIGIFGLCANQERIEYPMGEIISVADNQAQYQNPKQPQMRNNAPQQGTKRIK